MARPIQARFSRGWNGRLAMRSRPSATSRQRPDPAKFVGNRGIHRPSAAAMQGSDNRWIGFVLQLLGVSCLVVMLASSQARWFPPTTDTWHEPGVTGPNARLASLLLW